MCYHMLFHEEINGDLYFKLMRVIGRTLNSE